MTISEQYAEELGRQVDELEIENARLREALSLIMERYYIRGGEEALEIATRALAQ